MVIVLSVFCVFLAVVLESRTTAAVGIVVHGRRWVGCFMSEFLGELIAAEIAIYFILMTTVLIMVAWTRKRVILDAAAMTT